MFDWFMDFWTDCRRGWRMSRSTAWAVIQAVFIVAAIAGIGIIPWTLSVVRARNIGLAWFANVVTVELVIVVICVFAWIGRRAATKDAYKVANDLRDQIDGMNKRWEEEHRATP